MPRKAHWKDDLQNPQSPGKYSVPGLGSVVIKAADIRTAEIYNGECYVNLTHHSSHSNLAGDWLCGSFEEDA